MADKATKSARYETGMAMRRRVLGDAHVDRSERNSTAFDEPFQDLITEAAWGTVWSSPQWAPSQRSVVVLAILASLGREEEFALHLRATRNTGASREDIREALMHVAIYAGVPAANTAFANAKRIFAEMDADQEKDDA